MSPEFVRVFVIDNTADGFALLVVRPLLDDQLLGSVALVHGPGELAHHDKPEPIEIGIPIVAFVDARE
jgi:hypothetical protein